jgi:ERF superfamily
LKNIATALVKAQKAFGPALKTSTNPHFRSRYADLSACVEAVIDALNDNGIYLLQKNYDCADGIMVETVFVHESGEMLECGIVHFPATKKDPQGYASALTYGRRYSLMAACGIAPEDDDGNAASKPVPKHTSIKPIQEIVTEDRKEKLLTSAQFIVASMDAGEMDEALKEWESITDSEEKTHLWSLLDSKYRSAIKKAKNG